MDYHCCKMEFARTLDLLKDTLKKKNCDEDSELPVTDMPCKFL